MGNSTVAILIFYINLMKVLGFNLASSHKTFWFKSIDFQVGTETLEKP